jgi:hypothetical protein
MQMAALQRGELQQQLHNQRRPGLLVDAQAPQQLLLPQMLLETMVKVQTRNLL